MRELRGAIAATAALLSAAASLVTALSAGAAAAARPRPRSCRRARTRARRARCRGYAGHLTRTVKAGNCVPKAEEAARWGVPPDQQHLNHVAEQLEVVVETAAAAAVFVGTPPDQLLIEEDLRPDQQRLNFADVQFKDEATVTAGTGGKEGGPLEDAQVLILAAQLEVGGELRREFAEDSLGGELAAMTSRHQGGPQVASVFEAAIEGVLMNVVKEEAMDLAYQQARFFAGKQLEDDSQALSEHGMEAPVACKASGSQVQAPLFAGRRLEAVVEPVREGDAQAGADTDTAAGIFFKGTQLELHGRPQAQASLEVLDELQAPLFTGKQLEEVVEPVQAGDAQANVVTAAGFIFEGKQLELLGRPLEEASMEESDELQVLLCRLVVERLAAERGMVMQTCCSAASVQAQR